MQAGAVGRAGRIATPGSTSNAEGMMWHVWQNYDLAVMLQYTVRLLSTKIL